MKKLGILLVLMFAVTMASSAFAQSKVAVIDYPKCIRTSDAGKKANEEMKALETTWGGRIDAMRTEITKMENEFIAQEKVLTDSAKKTKIDEIQKKRLDHDNTLRQFQGEAEKKNEELMKKIVGDLEKIVADYAKEKKFDMILHSQSVAFNNNIPDISDEIIARYNKQK